MKIEVLQKSVKLYFVLVVALSLATYKFFFHLWAFDTIFFEYIFGTWIISVGIFLGYTMIETRLKPFSKWWLLPLIIPSIWFLFWVLDIILPWYGIDNLVFVLGLWTMLVSFPYIIYLLLAIHQEEAIKMKPRSLLKNIIIIFFIISSIWYIVGRYNYIFMSCHDFAIAWYAEPVNCYKIKN